jgi:hypothetical protein
MRMTPLWSRLGCGALALASVACSGRAVETIAAAPSDLEALPADGSTLKIGAPSLLGETLVPAGSPVTLRLVNVQGRYTAFPVSYEAELRDAIGTLIATRIFPSLLGTFTSYTFGPLLEGVEPYAWRARARYRDAAGPWSGSRSFSLERRVNITGPNQIDRAASPSLKATLTVTGVPQDCTTTGGWSTDDPTIATVSSQGVVTPRELGETMVRATCDGVAVAQHLRVVEIWEGQFLSTRCDSCIASTLRPGVVSTVRLVITEWAGQLNGQLDLQGFQSVPVKGTLASGRLDASGGLVDTHCDSSQYHLVVGLAIDNGNLSMRVQRALNTCTPTTTFDLDSKVEGQILNLHR